GPVKNRVSAQIDVVVVAAGEGVCGRTRTSSGSWWRRRRHLDDIAGVRIIARRIVSLDKIRKGRVRACAGICIGQQSARDRRQNGSVSKNLVSGDPHVI